MKKEKILEILDENSFIEEGERRLIYDFDYNDIAKEIEEQCNIDSVSNRFSDQKFIDNVCLSYRHDFGLLSEDEQDKVRLECKEWMRAIKNNEPY